MTVLDRANYRTFSPLQKACLKQCINSFHKFVLSIYYLPGAGLDGGVHKERYGKVPDLTEHSLVNWPSSVCNLVHEGLHLLIFVKFKITISRSVCWLQLVKFKVSQRLTNRNHSHEENFEESQHFLGPDQLTILYWILWKKIHKKYKTKCLFSLTLLITWNVEWKMNLQAMTTFLLLK